MDLDDDHRRPDGSHDCAVSATGKLSEALEYVERARGRLYDFHQLIGRADFLFEEAADQLAEAGHPDWEKVVRTEIVGRNVVPGRWTFQMIEEFDDQYWSCVRDVEAAVRKELSGGRRHVFEAELKAARRSAGRAAHEATPADLGEPAPD